MTPAEQYAEARRQQALEKVRRGQGAARRLGPVGTWALKR